MSDSKVYYAPYFSTDPIPGGHEIVSANDYRDAQSQLAALREELASAQLEIDTKAAEIVIADNYAAYIEQRLADAERRNVDVIGWRDPEFTWATIEAINKAKMQALEHDMSCFSIPLYGSAARPDMTEERREYEVTELAEFMSNLSGGLRHFAGYMIDAGWRKPAALNPNPEAASHDE